MPTRNKNSLAVIRKKKKEMADQIVHLVDENAQLKVVTFVLLLILFIIGKNEFFRVLLNMTILEIT